ncbi:MAG: glycosyltransferase family 9 protein [Candidatus Latescibacteria bacterium]|nr:glycosyltransferase family 9 protein [Candidatus Latescibacterota bacterium]MBT4138222.1 glycosyltransferase family 9 protein [Candidatus Latescibacterota bacterium]
MTFQAGGWLRQNLLTPVVYRLSSVQKPKGPTFSVAQALKSPKQILIAADSHPGAIFLAASQIWAIRNHYPNAQICLLARDDRAFIAREIPFVDKVVIYEDFLLPLGSKLQEAIDQLQTSSFDLAFCFSTETSFCPAYLCYKSGAQIRIGFQRANFPFFNIRIVPKPNETYEEQRLSLLLRTLGIPQVKERVSWSVSKESAEKILNRYLVGRKPDEQFIALDVSHTEGPRPSSKKFQEIAESILQNNKKARLLVFFDFLERKTAHQIKEALGARVLLFETDDLPKIVALLTACQYLIACNSDLFHLGTAMGLPIKGFFSNDDLARWISPTHKNVETFDPEATKNWSPDQIPKALQSPAIAKSN